jgi:hypothetical protein
MLLDQLKIIGNKCPVCEDDLVINLIVKSKYNSCHYRLSNNDYPLLFVKNNQFGEFPHSVFIYEGDVFAPSASAAIISINIVCSICKSYHVDFYSTNGNFRDIPINKIIEARAIEKITFNKVIHVENNFRKNETTFYKDYKKLLTTPLRSSRFWKNNNANELREKIESLMILL